MYQYEVANKTQLFLPFFMYVFVSPGSFRQEIVLGDSCA